MLSYTLQFLNLRLSAKVVLCFPDMVVICVTDYQCSYIGNFEMARSVMGGDGMVYDMLSHCLVCV